MRRDEGVKEEGCRNYDGYEAATSGTACLEGLVCKDFVLFRQKTVFVLGYNINFFMSFFFKFYPGKCDSIKRGSNQS